MMNVPNSPISTLHQQTTIRSSGLIVVLKILCLISVFILGGCCPPPEEFTPDIHYTPQEKQIQKLPTPFPLLSKEELCTEWGKELYVGLHFANDLDLYRAVTAFKRAKIFLPASKRARRDQIDFHVMQCYYLGGRYEDTLQVFDTSGLLNVDNFFPASKEMALMLYDCYQKTQQPEKGERIFGLLQQIAPEAAQTLKLGEALTKGDFCTLEQAGNERIDLFLKEYRMCAKDVSKARLYNALLPGAGYAYVGQMQTALTSFCINALFTGAAYFSYRNHNIPLAVILTSLEGGWYFGGIHGAGLSAQKYNENLYAINGKEVMVCEKLFPVLMWEVSF